MYCLVWFSVKKFKKLYLGGEMERVGKVEYLHVNKSCPSFGAVLRDSGAHQPHASLYTALPLS